MIAMTTSNSTSVNAFRYEDPEVERWLGFACTRAALKEKFGME